MGRYFDEEARRMPPRIRAAFEYLDYVRETTQQTDASIPARQLSALEKSVEAASLRAVQLYVLGEMDFDEPGVSAPIAKDDDQSTGESTRAGC